MKYHVLLALAFLAGGCSSQNTPPVAEPSATPSVENRNPIPQTVWSDDFGRVHTKEILELQKDYNTFLETNDETLARWYVHVKETGLLDSSTLLIPWNKLLIRLNGISNWDPRSNPKELLVKNEHDDLVMAKDLAMARYLNLLKKVPMSKRRATDEFDKDDIAESADPSLMTEDFLAKLQRGATAAEAAVDKLETFDLKCAEWKISGNFPSSAVNEPLPKCLTNSLGMIFVTVPGTKVLFSVWDTRVQDYQAFVDDMCLNSDPPLFPQGPTHPAVDMTASDASLFCIWLTRKERAEGLIGLTMSYRLPTDIEWSIAVGLADDKGLRPYADLDVLGPPKENGYEVKKGYPWGSQWPPPVEAGNFAKELKVDDYENTSPVGSFAANKFGLFDMGGDVKQWCEVYSEGYLPTVVLRGSSYLDSYEGYMRSSHRDTWNPGYSERIGFRCVLTPSSASN